MNIGEGETRCFWLEPTGKVRLSLRRFTFSETEHDAGKRAHRNCPASTHGHDASVWLDVWLPVVKQKTDHGFVMPAVSEDQRPTRDDPRWPQVCDACGESFRADDEWQVNQAEQYVRSDNGEMVHMRHYPGRELAGALFDAWWRHGYEVTTADGSVRRYQGPDGIALVAVCPNGFPWEVDGPATGGGGWTRTGDPRQPETLTVQPSILAGDYHGFLQHGVFTAHIG